MKKLVLMAAAMLMFALPAANAQKVNTSSEVAKLEKADAACNDAKKGIKAATWLTLLPISSSLGRPTATP